MPKAGSTAIQMALHAAQEAKLSPNGIWFTPPAGAFNDSALFDMLVAEDLPRIREYAEEKIETAITAGAETVIFSAERLFTIDDARERIGQLGMILREFASEVCVIIVAREIRELLRSYITQLIYNGRMTIEDDRLAEWIVDQTISISECLHPVHFIPLERKSRDQNVAETLISISTGLEIDIALERANITPSRPIIYALAEGFAARLHAIVSAEDINSKHTDQFRAEFTESFDRSMHSCAHSAEVYEVMTKLNAGLETGIADYIDQCLEACDPVKLDYYNALVTGTSPEALSELEEVAPAQMDVAPGDEERAIRSV